jgi:iron complex outermembrane receptor protein
LNQSQGTLTQVEVLKGPQGALYGRNAEAGAIVVQTAKPEDRLSGSITGSYAENNTARVNAYLGGPISNDVGLLVSGDYYTTDGFYRNKFLNEKVVDNQEYWNVNGRLMANLGSNTKLDLKSHYGRLNSTAISLQRGFRSTRFGRCESGVL